MISKAAFYGCAIGVSGVILLYFWRKRLWENKKKTDINGINNSLFDPIKIDTIYDHKNKHNIINVDNYKRGGFMNTFNLKTFNKNEFKNPFINTKKYKLNKKINNILIFYNPISGRAKFNGNTLINQYIVNMLSDYSINYILIKSENPKFITNYLINTNNKSSIINKHFIDLFVVCGGDGTFTEYLNGYFIGEYNKYDIPTIFLPGGTFNNFCNHCNNSKQFISYNQIINAFENILKHNSANDIYYIDCMRIKDLFNNYNTYSINAVIYGMVSITMSIRRKLRPYIGQYKFGTFIATCITIFRKPTFQCRITAYFDNNREYSFDIDLAQLACSKTKMVGPDSYVIPLCKSDNGLMDVIIAPNISRIQLATIWSKFKSGTHLLNTKDSKLIFLRCQKIKIVPFKGYNDECLIDGELDNWTTPCIINTASNILPIIPLIETGK